MSEVGSYLKKVRENQKLTLDQVQASTKIRKVYLDAIENGQFNQLPGNFYIRAFIKSYSEALGIEFDQLLLKFGDELNQYSPAQDERPNAITRKDKMANLELVSKLGSSFLVVGLIVLIIVLVYIFALSKDVEKSQNLDQTKVTNEAKIYASPKPSPSPTPSPEPSISPSDNLKSSDGTNVEVTLVGKETNTLIYNVSNASKIQLSFGFDEQCWTLFQNQNNNGSVIKGALNKNMYESGEKDTLESINSVHLRFGNAKSVTLAINGVIIDDPSLKEEGAKNIQINLVKAVEGQ